MSLPLEFKEEENLSNKSATTLQVTLAAGVPLMADRFSTLQPLLCVAKTKKQKTNKCTECFPSVFWPFGSGSDGQQTFLSACIAVNLHTILRLRKSNTTSTYICTLYVWMLCIFFITVGETLISHL